MGHQGRFQEGNGDEEEILRKRDKLVGKGGPEETMIKGQRAW